VIKKRFFVKDRVTK